MPQSSPPTLAQPAVPLDDWRIENDPEGLIRSHCLWAPGNSTRGARADRRARAEKSDADCPRFVKKQRWSWVIERSDLYDLYDLYDL